MLQGLLCHYHWVLALMTAHNLHNLLLTWHICIIRVRTRFQLNPDSTMTELTDVIAFLLLLFQHVSLLLVYDLILSSHFHLLQLLLGEVGAVCVARGVIGWAKVLWVLAGELAVHFLDLVGFGLVEGSLVVVLVYQLGSLMHCSSFFILVSLILSGLQLHLHILDVLLGDHRLF